MSILSAIWNTLTRIFVITKSVLAVAHPILKGLRQNIPEINSILQKFEDGIAQGGIEADNFLDRNLDTLVKIKDVSADGVAVMHQLGSICDRLILFSQVETPDTITPQEAETIGADLLALKDLLKRFAEKSEPLERALEKVK